MSESLLAVRVRHWITLVSAILVFTVCLVGFGLKFIEFIHTFMSETGGEFAITPIVNYFMATLGFLCMLIWAAMNGMFFDVEGPKRDMLQIDRQLDRDSHFREADVVTPYGTPVARQRRPTQRTSRDEDFLS